MYRPFHKSIFHEEDGFIEYLWKQNDGSFELSEKEIEYLENIGPRPDKQIPPSFVEALKNRNKVLS